MFGYWRNPFAQRTSYCFFALHKSGSSYVHTVLHRIFSRLKYRHQQKLTGNQLAAETYYGPIRLFELPCEQLFRSSRILLQVRDPRDILTSLYFSLRYSHCLPDSSPADFLENRKKLEEVDINDFVIEKADEIGRRFEKFESFLGRDNVLLMHYEQMVTHFDQWFDRIVQFCGLNWNFKLRRCLQSLREEADFSVDSEDVTNHKRQVHPGDFRRKLTSETIEILNKKFEPVIDLFYGPASRSLLEPVVPTHSATAESNAELPAKSA